MLWFKVEMLKCDFGSTKEAYLDQAIHFEFWLMKIENQTWIKILTQVKIEFNSLRSLPTLHHFYLIESKTMC